MEKLIELLNEYDEWWNWRKLHWKGLWCEDHNTIWYKDKELTCEQDEVVAYLISKKFWFIEWLVDNDKIDFESENYPLKKYYPYFNDDVLAIVSQDCNTYEDHCRVCYEKYESLLMLLAIQDEPIEFLISVLK